MATAPSGSACLLLVVLLSSLEVKVANGLDFDRNKFVSDVSEWEVHVFMLLSMLTQLLLLGTGGFRKRSTFLRFVAWIAYTASDAVAVYTLGLMIRDSRCTGDHTNVVFSLWGPILLLHLGAPDNITAYANADTELWLRHGLNFLLQLGFVLYLVSCLGSGPYLTVAIVLLIAGSNKYAERTLALYYGSKAAVVAAVQPIYKYMQLEAGIFGSEEYHYVVVGEADWYKTMRALAANNGRRFNFEESLDKAGGLVRFHEVEKMCEEEALPGKQHPLAQYQEVESEHGQSSQHLLDLCLAHALFKMLRRRLTALYMFEKTHVKTRMLYTHHLRRPERVIQVLDMELRFLFDSIYSKASGTAFTRFGLCCRLLNLSLLLVSFLFVVQIVTPHGDSSQYHASWGVTMTLLVGALGIEVYQLLRILLSDWTLVRLACAYVRARRRSRGSKVAGFHAWLHYLARTAFFGLLYARLRIGKLRPDYWSLSFLQHSMIHCPQSHNRALLQAFRYTRAALGKLLGNSTMILLHLIPVTRLPKLHTNRLKHKLMAKVLLRLESRDGNLAQVSGVTLQREENKAFQFASNTDLEHAILHWHIASAICELDAERTTSTGGSQSDDLSDSQVSRYLSRYVMYLLVAKTELLPCHPDIGKLVYDQTAEELEMRWPNHSDILNEGRHSEFNESTSSALDKGIELGYRLREAGYGRCWHVLADVWCDFIITIALANRPYEHLEQLAGGGEFVTHIWVLLNQIGISNY